MIRKGIKVIQYSQIVDEVAKLYKTACCIVTPDMKVAFQEAQANEVSLLGKDILGKILQNAEIAKVKQMAICQDTGMVVVFLEVGQDVRIEGGYIEDTIN